MQSGDCSASQFTLLTAPAVKYEERQSTETDVIELQSVPVESVRCGPGTERACGSAAQWKTG